MATPILFDPEPILRRFPDRTAQEIADALDVSKATVEAWRHGRRRLRVTLADRLACEVDSHPGVEWPDEWHTFLMARRFRS